MLTDRDITVRIVAMGLDPQTSYVTDAMTGSLFEKSTLFKEGKVCPALP
jgi:hypothetical protein